MTIKQVLEARGIYSVDLELELLRAVAGGNQKEYYEYRQPMYIPPIWEPSPTTVPWQPPYEITCGSTTADSCTVEYS